MQIEGAVWIQLMNVHSAPISLTKINLITAWISNHIHYNAWDEITYPFPATPWKFKNGKITSSHTLLDMWLLIHAGITVFYVS